jgi:bifunctional UDP-N-acetylglucosamine pyrophosphorylase/glucosamine-1-phosphate N-acetyltransferase
MYKKGILILAAGRGTRLNTAMPKPLVNFAGKSFLNHILDALPKANTHVVISPNNYAAFKSQFPSTRFIMQKTALGTGDAVKAAIAALSECDSTIVLCADMPLIPKNLIQELFNLSPGNRVVGFKPSDLSQYGLIETTGKHITKILEPPFHHQTKSTIANSGIIEISKNTLPQVCNISPCKISKEFYLTQLIQPQHLFSLFHYKGDATHLTGINTPTQLAELEEIHLKHLQEQLSLIAHVEQINAVYLNRMPKIGKNVKIGRHVHFYGEVTIGDYSVVATGSIITDSKIGQNVHIKPYSIISHSVIEDDVILGPFCQVQQNSKIQQHSIVGNFVEITRSQLGNNTKAKHLCYIGDSIISHHVNIGAGAITCNYDPIRRKKFQTIIGSYCQIGANVSLIAPIQIQDHTIIGAGTVLCKDTKSYQIVYTHRMIKTKPQAQILTDDY